MQSGENKWENWQHQHHEYAWANINPRDGELTVERLEHESFDENFEQQLRSDSDEYRAAERKILRKLDLTLMPTVWFLYFFNYLDRNNLGAANLDHFQNDLGLKGDDFQTLVALVNVTYMCTQIPSQLLITLVQPCYYLASWAALWSIVSSCMAATHTFEQALAVRLCLGIAEAPFFPGAIFLISAYYTRRELAFRASILYSGLIIASGVASLIASGIFSGLGGALGLAGWRWMFIIEGAISFCGALVAFVTLPGLVGSDAGSARWLFTEKEKLICADRIYRDRIVGTKPMESPLRGLVSCVKDVNTWMLAFMLLANHSAYGFTSFFPTIMKGLHFGGTTVTLALTAPPYFVATAFVLFVAWSSDRRQERGWHIAIPTSLTVAGAIITLATTNRPARYFAAFLFAPGCMAANSLIAGWAGTTLNQTPEKRACAFAIINIVAQLGNIWSPYFYPNKDYPRYIMGFILMMAFALACAVSALLMKWRLTKTNRRLALTETDVTKPFIT